SFVSVVVYAVLEEENAIPRVVQVTLSSYKVDALRGEEVWRCLGQPTHLLLQALSQHLALRIQGQTLLPTGDLLWDGEAKKGSAFPVMEWAASWLSVGATQEPVFPGLLAADRHPIQLRVPVFLAEISIEAGPEGHLL